MDEVQLSHNAFILP
ncbi:hypothetical protein Tco_1518345, partial [Tanacetum coccineum]